MRLDSFGWTARAPPQSYERNAPPLDWSGGAKAFQLTTREYPMHNIAPQGPTGSTGPASISGISPNALTGPTGPAVNDNRIKQPTGPNSKASMDWHARAIHAKEDPLAEKQATPSSVIELTLLTSDGPFTKTISLAPDGTLKKDVAGGVMSHGTAERICLAGVAELGPLIEGLTSNQALALGTLRADLPDKVEVTTKRRLLNGVARPDLIARTNADIVYDGPSLALLDFDSKGMPVTVRTELKRVDGLFGALLVVLPLTGIALLVRHSTSAGLFRTDTGAPLPGSDGMHVHVEVKDGADVERFLKTLHDRCWLAGFGWMMVSAAGTLLERSIIDRMVFAPSRPVFEGPPVLVPPVQQKRRRAVVVPGVALDTKAACPPLSLVEQARLEELKAKAHERLAPEMARARAAFIGAKTKRHVARGMSEQAARQMVERQCEGVLRPDVVLPFDDPELAGCTVGDVLTDPELYEGETLADPLEGVEYGTCKAMVMRRPDGTPWIHSFAHGETNYKLKHDVASVRKAMEAAAKDEVVPTLARLAVVADLSAVELDNLRRLAKTLSGVGLNPIKATIRAAQQNQDAQEAQWVRARRAAQRQDPRPQILAPLPDAEFLPVMETIDQVLGVVGGLRPPSRNIEYEMARVRKTPVINMHAFTPSGANPEETTAAEVEAAAKLPPPEQWVLSKMSEVEITELIERHINFYDEDASGLCRSWPRSPHHPSCWRMGTC
jgi:hypothetical protein